MPHQTEEEDKPCRACSDFKTWTKQQKQSKQVTPPPPEHSTECPLNKEDLGRSSWGLLHSMASYFPEKPTNDQRNNMITFMNIFAQFYPCEPCALEFQDDIKKHPPKASTREIFAKWLCDRHNTVNVKLGKPIFDCSKVHERWKDGWLDGSCD